VWLNTPRRPLEASGTSGMKVPPNGGVNLSILDGWWCEGYAKDNGWAIGAGEDYDDQEYQDEVESTAIYDLLENEIVPTYYERSSDDVPREWTRIMKNSMRTVNADFNTHRQVEDYTQRFYIPCLENKLRLAADDFGGAKDLASWRQRVFAGWSKVQVTRVEATLPASQPMGSTLPIRAHVNLGDIPADEVLVEAYHGVVDANGQIAEGETATLFAGEAAENGSTIFEGGIACRRAGKRGYTVRVVPRKNGYPLDRFETGLITWWNEDQVSGGSSSTHDQGQSVKQG
jgi:starch phosphorylase